MKMISHIFPAQKSFGLVSYSSRGLLLFFFLNAKNRPKSEEYVLFSATTQSGIVVVKGQGIASFIENTPQFFRRLALVVLNK